MARFVAFDTKQDTTLYINPEHVQMIEWDTDEDRDDMPSSISGQ